jgi:hypothetical protein
VRGVDFAFSVPAYHSLLFLCSTETVPGTDFVEDFHKTIARMPRPEQGTPPVTTKGNKVEIASTVVASQRVAHRRKTRTLKTEGCGTPSSTYMG